MNDLPPGFTLDAPMPNAAVSGPAGAPQNNWELPPGFVLDAPQTASAAPQKKPFGLADTWPARLAKGIYSTAAEGLGSARDVLTGKAQLPSAGGAVPGSVDTSDPAAMKTMENVIGLGTFMTPMNPAVRAGDRAITGVMRPGLTERAQVANAAGRVGVEIPSAAISDSMIAQRTAQGLSNVPLGGSALRQASETATAQLGQAADTTALAATGSKVLPEQAGAAARAALTEYIGPTTAVRAQKLYDKVDGLINPAVTTELNATRTAAADIVARRSNATLKGEGGAVQQVLDAVTAPGGLNYQGIKDLRSAIGEQLNGGILPADISQKELKTIYGALSDDLASSVRNAGGPQAAAAFERANTYYGLVSQRREELARILGGDNRSNEGIFAAIQRLAGSTASADAKLLAQARKAMPVEEWKDISAGVIGQLGRDAEGTFSPLRFVTEYGKISDAGKNILFNSTGDKTLRQSLDDIALVSSKWKQWQRFSNPSGTAQNLIGNTQLAGIGGAVTAGVMTGSLMPPLVALGGIVGASALSRILATPATAASMAKWTRVYQRAAMSPSPHASMAALSAASRNFATTLTDKLGLNVSPADFMRALQGPIPVRPEENQQQ